MDHTSDRTQSLTRTFTLGYRFIRISALPQAPGSLDSDTSEASEGIVSEVKLALLAPVLLGVLRDVCAGSEAPELAILRAREALELLGYRPYDGLLNPRDLTFAQLIERYTERAAADIIHP